MYGLIVAALVLAQCGPQGCPRPATVSPQFVAATPQYTVVKQQACSQPRRKGLFAFLKKKR